MCTDCQLDVGISTASLYPELTENAIDHLIKLGYKNYELFINSDYELSKDFLDIINKKRIEYDLNIVSIHPYTSELETSLFFSNYQRRWDTGVDYYTKYFQCAQMIGAKYVIIHGARRREELSLEGVKVRLNRLGAISEKYNVKILLENVDRCISRSLDVLKYLSKGDNLYGFALDTKQAYRTGHSLKDYIDAMGTGLKHLHISDHDEVNECVAPGKGKENYKDLIQTLYNNGFSGTMIIEIYSTNAEDTALIAGKEMLEKLIIKQIKENR